MCNEVVTPLNLLNPKTKCFFSFLVFVKALVTLKYRPIGNLVHINESFFKHLVCFERLLF